MDLFSWWTVYLIPKMISQCLNKLEYPFYIVVLTTDETHRAFKWVLSETTNSSKWFCDCTKKFWVFFTPFLVKFFNLDIHIKILLELFLKQFLFIGRRLNDNFYLARFTSGNLNEVLIKNSTERIISTRGTFPPIETLTI